MMKTANLEKITVLNRKQASDRMVASTCNCSWRYDVHLPAKKSAYEEQKGPVKIYAQIYLQAPAE